MKNKSSILVLTVLVTAICLFYLSFTLVSRGIKKDMLAYADQKVEEAKAEGSDVDLSTVHKAAFKAYKDSIWRKEVYLGYTYEEVKNFELNLGLDLQGGMNITLVVSPVEIIKALSGNSQDPAFLESIAAAKKDQLTQQEKFTTLFYNEWKSRKGEGKLWEVFLTSDNNNKISAKSTDDEILALLNTEMDGAIDRTMIVLRSRIDKFGATQPVIQDVKSTGRIEIQLPGVDDEERIIRQVKAVAQLEFLEVYTPQEYNNVIGMLNNILVQQNKLKKAEGKVTDAEVEAPADLYSADSTVADTAETVVEAEDTGLFAEDTTVTDTAATETADVSEQFPLSEYFQFTQTGSIVAKQKDYDKVQAFLASKEVQDIMPDNMTLLWSIPSKDDAEGVVEVLFVKKGSTAPAPLTGEVITDARQDFDAMGKVAVSMSMNPEGARIWEKMTREISSKNVPNMPPHRIAIVLDDVVYSAPSVREAIPNGNSSISGNFDQQEAIDLSNILKAGKLPAPTEIERMVVVGPSLGKEAIDRGFVSLLAGLGLVIIFMVLYYSKGGFIADLALLINILFILGVLSTPSFGTTLTLPGIAGIVLTIGMSIDANVLIFERVREELKLGKPVAAAISNGYSRAFWTIFDSNLTTLITAVILAYFGTGLVKGFAVTLIIGIICSFFSAVFITRLLMEYFMGKKGKAISFATGFSKGLFQNLNFDFIAKRKIAYVFSGVVIAVGVVLMTVQGLNLGVAFKGGDQFIVKFDDTVVANEVESALKDGFGGAGTMVKTFDGADQLQITTSYRETLGEEIANKDSVVRAVLLDKGLANYASLNPSIQQTIVVGPTIADDIKATSIESILIALVAIFFYIFGRFRKVQFGLGALVALFHDVMIVLSVFSIFRLFGISFEIDEVFIAAVLTIVGYSINDTVVVFDRVREYLEGKKIEKGTIGGIINNSLNSTLSRTLMTSITTLIVVVVLLVFGGEALRGFSFALFIGVLIGTYSSVFIATPVVMDTAKEDKK